MKPLTFIELDNKTQLEEAYRDFEEQFELGLSGVNQQLEQGKVFLNCSQSGIIYLDDSPDARFKEVENPYKKEEQLIFDKDNSTNKDLEGVKLDDQRVRIDAILKFIDLEISEEALDKLIEVFNLENKYKDSVSIKSILNLKN